jgi:4-hydroxybutyrate CoA-transferase
MNCKISERTLIGFKYCGGCNPVIDRAKLVQEIQRRLSAEFTLATDQSPTQWDIGILVCGCLTACADQPDFRNLARRWIVVAGNSVDHSTAPEKELAEIVLRKIRS